MDKSLFCILIREGFWFLFNSIRSLGFIPGWHYLQQKRFCYALMKSRHITWFHKKMFKFLGMIVDKIWLLVSCVLLSQPLKLKIENWKLIFSDQWTVTSETSAFVSQVTGHYISNHQSPNLVSQVTGHRSLKLMDFFLSICILSCIFEDCFKL